MVGSRFPHTRGVRTAADIYGYAGEVAGIPL